jgi:anti-sigma B factor antagonist
VSLLTTSASRDGANVLSVHGDLDVSTASRLGTDVVAALATGVALVVVDLSDVSFLDSSGLGSLVLALRKAENAGVALRLVVTSSEVLALLATTGLDHVLPVRSSVEAALVDEAAAQDR